MGFIISRRDEVGQAAWDAFADATDEAWLWHRFDMQTALATWPGRSDRSFAVMDAHQGALLALVPVHLTQNTRARLITLKTLNSLGGPACANGLPEKVRRGLQQSLRDYLVALARQCGAMDVNLALAPLAPAYRGDRCPRVNPLLHFGCDNTLTQTYIIDLRRSEEELWQGLFASCRNQIRKAETEGYTIREADSIADIERYYEMHLETYGRTGATPHPFAYFQQIWEKFTCQGYSHIFLCERGGEIVAAANVGAYKGAMIYWTGAGKTPLPSRGVNNLLQWHAIGYARKHGYEWYESGEAFPNLSSGKLKGLNDFKRTFGGELYPYYQGRLIARKHLHGLYMFLRNWRRSRD